MRAAAYIANSNDASVGTDSEGTKTCGRMITAMEEQLATRTLIAVTNEASRIAFVVVPRQNSIRRTKRQVLTVKRGMKRYSTEWRRCAEATKGVAESLSTGRRHTASTNPSQCSVDREILTQQVGSDDARRRVSAWKQPWS